MAFFHCLKLINPLTRIYMENTPYPLILEHLPFASALTAHHTSLAKLRLEVWRRVQQPLLRVGGVLGAAPAPLPGMPRVAHFHYPFAALEGEVARQTRQRYGEGCQQRPPGAPLVGPAPAGVVRTRLPPIRLRTVVEQSLNTTKTRRVVYYGVCGAQTPVLAYPTGG